MWLVMKTLPEGVSNEKVNRKQKGYRNHYYYSQSFKNWHNVEATNYTEDTGEHLI